MPSPEVRRSRLAWSLAYAVAGVVLFTAYLAQSSRATYVNSDGASNALQAWAMLHGNVLLHGWAMSDVSFYTTELPEYMLAELVRGLRPEVVHICAALTYTLLVLLAAALAKGRATGRQGVTRALLATGIMLAPQLGDPSGALLLSLNSSGTGILLLSPDHVGTGVPLLLTWLLIDRGPGWQGTGRGGSRWLVPVLAGTVLAWAAVADPLAGVIGALPLALVCGFRVCQGLAARTRPPGYELSLLVAAILSVPVAFLATRAITAAGGWTLTPVRPGLIGPGTLRLHAYTTVMGILQLFGADFLGQPTAWRTVFALVHLGGVALALVAFCVAVRRFRTAEPLVQLLTVAIVVNIVTYVFSAEAQHIANTREIASVLPFGAVLAGRLGAGGLGAGGLGAGGLGAGGLGVDGRAPARWAAVTVGLLVACYAAMLGFDVSQPPVSGPPAALAAWLTAHDLTRGLGGYWQANSVTLDTGGAVQVRAIDLVHGQLIPGAYWEADQAWYDPAANYADFVVDQPDRPGNPRYPGPLIRRMIAEAGKPDRLYVSGEFAIAVWKTNLLTRLR
jgi:hypothetical protein